MSPPDGPGRQASRGAPTALSLLIGAVLLVASVVAACGDSQAATSPAPSQKAASAAPVSPSPSQDAEAELCRQWRSYLDWAREEEAAGSEMDRTLAAAVVMWFQGMRGVAPAEMGPRVDAVIMTYTTYATAPEPIQVPLSGQTAARMYEALRAIDAYCGTQAIP